MARRALSGYDLAREMKRPVGYFWQARHSQIYPQLARLRGQATACLLYGWILRRADHVFVQTDRMKRDVCRRRIDPAKGERAFGKRGMWTILMLNGDAMESWLLKGGKNSSYLRDIGAHYPAFQAAIGDGVGTLGLELEGSGSNGGVGTLGLTLE